MSREKKLIRFWISEKGWVLVTWSKFSIFEQCQLTIPTLLCPNWFFGKSIQLIIAFNGFILHTQKDLETRTISHISEQSEIFHHDAMKLVIFNNHSIMGFITPNDDT